MHPFSTVAGTSGDQTWSLDKYYFAGGPHPPTPRDIMGFNTLGSQIQHIGGHKDLFNFMDTLKIFRIENDRMVIGSRFSFEFFQGVYIKNNNLAIWTDFNGDELAPPSEITNPTAEQLALMPHVNLGNRYLDYDSDANGTLYWGTFKLPLFQQHAGGRLEYRWDDIEHIGTDLDTIRSLNIGVDADSSLNRYVIATELDTPPAARRAPASTTSKPSTASCGGIRTRVR